MEDDGATDDLLPPKMSPSPLFPTCVLFRPAEADDAALAETRLDLEADPKDPAFLAAAAAAIIERDRPDPDPDPATDRLLAPPLPTPLSNTLGAGERSRSGFRTLKIAPLANGSAWLLAAGSAWSDARDEMPRSLAIVHMYE